MRKKVGKFNRPYKRFSENLLKLLDKRGWTETQLAEKTGISRVTISYYINEHNFPMQDNLEKIANALCVDVEELTGNKVLSLDEENTFLEAFRDMRKVYPEETLLIISPSTYAGYDLETGEQIVLKVERKKR